MLKVGDIIPWESGELFVTLSGAYDSGRKKEMAVIHADINAAQNLQKRFWQQNPVFRMPCKLVKYNDEEFYVPKYESIEKRMGKGRLVKISGFDAYKWEDFTKIRIKKNSNDGIPEIEDLEKFEQVLEEAEEAQGEYKTFFVDHSGYVLSKNLFSLFLGDDQLSLVGKLDTVILENEQWVPVESKHSAAPDALQPFFVHGRELVGSAWPNDQVQLCAQGLLLQANGYASSYGYLYYRGNKKRVRVEFTPALLEATREYVTRAQKLTMAEIPRPLKDSNKCFRCSLRLL